MKNKFLKVNNILSRTIKSGLRYKISIFLAVLICQISTPQIILPQVKSGEVLEKILAVVGNEIITQSDIDGYLMMLQQQNPSLDVKSPAVRNQVLEFMVNEKLVITKAIEDSIQVSDDEVNQRLDYLIQSKVQQYGSEKRLEDVLGISISRLKFEYRDEVRKSILSERLKQTKFGEIKVTPKECEEFYKDYKDSLSILPVQIELYHIVKNVEANATAKEDSYKLAKKIRDSILSGGNFADFAKRYSSDPGTKSEGGELGWVERGKLFPEYEKAAFALQEGEVSLPVETPFGFHIIQTLEKKKESIRTRHILFKFGQTDADKDSTKNLLLELKRRVEAGEKFEDLAKHYSDDKDTKGFGGFIGKALITELPAGVKDILDKLTDGGISDPLPYNADQTKQSFHILYKKKTYPEHKPTLADDYPQIERLAVNFKQNKLYTDWIATLRKEMYWEIKE
jgi:peptidyl-prolyl cis-trans isomerase SurA